MRKLNLNPNQQKAVDHINGPMMVLAGPGSGKTAVITARAAHLVDAGIPARNILVITYSKAAAQEMEQRFKLLFGQDTTPAVTFGTFHSVFYRMLRRKKNYSLEQIFGEGERRTLIRGFLTEMNYDLDDEFLSQVMGEMSLVRNELHDMSHYHSVTIGAEHFRELLDKYHAFKVEKNKIDFDDMLCYAYEMIGSEQAELDYWRNMYTHIMIDEFQDINAVQYEMIRLLAAPKNNLFIVGDDDQSIYRFRGARPEFLLNFPKDFPQGDQVVLETNYRSTDPIIKCANRLIVANTLRYDKDIKGTGRDGPKPILLSAADQNQEAIQIAEKIRALWKKGADLDEIAVAYRLNLQARAFMDAFLNMNIPFKTRDEIPTIYDHWVAEDLFAFLRVARRLGLRQKVGYDPDATRIINKPFRFISKAFLQGLKKDDQDLFRAYSYSDSLHTATKAGIEELHRDLLSL
ncbi:MAG: ATP-dependent helicase, partial [Defluviitaleaceae bacterium]|nr:ATP-dependent helicase [Defluviitaleaceae bacterium]